MQDLSAGLSDAALSGKQVSCEPIHQFERCILALNLGEPATTAALTTHSKLIERCDSEFLCPRYLYISKKTAKVNY